MPQNLTSIELDEVSLVDKGANQHAAVVLMKRDYACKRTGCPNNGKYARSCKMDDCPMIGKCEGDHACEKCAAMACDTHVEKSPDGVHFNIGIKEEGGSDVQSVVFDKEKWSEADAKKWLKNHNMSTEKVDEKENTLRFRQKDPGDYAKFRMIKPGKEVSKALRASQSLSQINAAVARAVQDKFTPKGKNGLASYTYVMDYYKDDVVFNSEGETYRAPYTVKRNDDGTLDVELGDKVPIEVVYQDRVSKCEQEVPDELQLRLASVKAKALLSKMNSCHNSSDGRFCASGGGASGPGGEGSKQSSSLSLCQDSYQNDRW